MLDMFLTAEELIDSHKLFKVAHSIRTVFLNKTPMQQPYFETKAPAV